MKKTIGLLAMLIFAVAINAQVSSVSKITSRHEGFFLSMALGVNHTNLKIEPKNGEGSLLNGDGPVFDLKIGGALTEDLILHAVLLQHTVSRPKIPSGEKIYELSLSEVMLGAGITYYMEDNFFISPSIGWANFVLDNSDDNSSIGTDKGLSFQIKGGKEWWVSPRWGLGIAIYYHGSNVLNGKGLEYEERITSNNYGIVFNATLNGR